jgi:hypothetical protein
VQNWKKVWRKQDKATFAVFQKCVLGSFIGCIKEAASPATPSQMRRVFTLYGRRRI